MGVTHMGGGGVVLLDVAAVLEAEVDVQFPLDCEAGILSPQISKHLANQPYRFLNHV